MRRFTGDQTCLSRHRLFSLPVSLPVRGADGLAKRALYGGIERQRLSSQSVKAHLRANTGLVDTMGDLTTSLGLDLSVRCASDTQGAKGASTSARRRAAIMPSDRAHRR